MREISSLQHPLVKHFVKLRESKDYRFEQQRIVISGLKLVQELSSRFPLRTLLLENGCTPPFPVDPDQIYYVTPQILKKATGLENPDPYAAEIDMPAPQDLSSAKLLLVLDGISDPGNLGTLLRTARALGWDAAFLTPRSTDPYNEKAVRAAKGATFTLPWKSGTWEELASLLSQTKMTLLAADAKGKDIAGCAFSPPIALALGNESHGLSPEIRNIAQMIAVPMKGRMESLNVATAGAILMYHLKGSS